MLWLFFQSIFDQIARGAHSISVAAWRILGPISSGPKAESGFSFWIFSQMELSGKFISSNFSGRSQGGSVGNWSFSVVKTEAKKLFRMVAIPVSLETTSSFSSFSGPTLDLFAVLDLLSRNKTFLVSSSPLSLVLSQTWFWFSTPASLFPFLLVYMLNTPHTACFFLYVAQSRLFFRIVRIIFCCIHNGRQFTQRLFLGTILSSALQLSDTIPSL